MNQLPLRRTPGQVTIHICNSSSIGSGLSSVTRGEKERRIEYPYPSSKPTHTLLDFGMKLNNLPKARKTSLHMPSTLWIRKTLPTLLQEDYYDVPKPEQLSTETENNQRKLMGANELSKLGMVTFDKSHGGKALDQMSLKTLSDLFEYNKAWRPGSGQRMTREEAKTSYIYLRKGLQIRTDLSKLESFVGGRVGKVRYIPADSNAMTVQETHTPGDNPLLSVESLCRTCEEGSLISESEGKSAGHCKVKGCKKEKPFFHLAEHTGPIHSCRDGQGYRKVGEGDGKSVPEDE
ncbi:hypothetical protein Tco_0595253 [Tanacetum coccineum]